MRYGRIATARSGNLWPQAFRVAVLEKEMPEMATNSLSFISFSPLLAIQKYYVWDGQRRKEKKKADHWKGNKVAKRLRPWPLISLSWWSGSLWPQSGILFLVSTAISILWDERWKRKRNKDCGLSNMNE